MRPFFKRTWVWIVILLVSAMIGVLVYLDISVTNPINAYYFPKR
jgi:hypothetical protein